MSIICPNPACRGNQRKLPTARFKSRRQKTYYCKLCKISWNASHGTFSYNIKTPLATVLKSIYKVAKGISLRQTSKEERVSVDSIYNWIDRAKEFPKNAAALLSQHLNVDADEAKKLIHSL